MCSTTIPVKIEEIPHDSWFYTPMPAWLGILAPVIVFLLTIILEERKLIVRRIMTRIGIMVQVIRIRDSISAELNNVDANLTFLKSLGQGNLGGMLPSLHIEQYYRYPTEWQEDVLCIQIEPISKEKKRKMQSQTKEDSGLQNVTDNYSIDVENFTMASRVQDFHFISGLIVSAQLIHEDRKRLIPELHGRISEFHDKLSSLIVETVLWLEKASQPEIPNGQLQPWSSEISSLFKKMQHSKEAQIEVSFKDYYLRFLEQALAIIAKHFSKEQIESNQSFLQFQELTGNYTKVLAQYSDYNSRFITTFENQKRLYSNHKKNFEDFVTKQMQFDVIRPWYLFVKKPKRK